MEIQNVVEFCCNCEKIKPLVEKRKNGVELSEEEVESIRWDCRYCRSFGRGGIYKADAIISLLESKDKNRNVGKKAVKEKRYGNAIKKLREDGKSIRDIADILGMSKTTVQKIVLNQRKSEGSEVNE